MRAPRRLLVLDAALSRCSAALVEAGRCVDVRDCGDSRGSSVSLPGAVRDLLAPHGPGLDAVAVTVGPGSYTGLRSAIALAQGVAIGAGASLIGVTVAEALLAATALPPSRTPWIAIDARRPGRVFLCRDGAVEAALLDALPRPAGPLIVLGDAAAAVCQALASFDVIDGGVSAIDPASVGLVAMRRLLGEPPPCDVLPLYVEPAEARAAVLRAAPA